MESARARDDDDDSATAEEAEEEGMFVCVLKIEKRERLGNKTPKESVSCSKNEKKKRELTDGDERKIERKNCYAHFPVHRHAQRVVVIPD